MRSDAVEELQNIYSTVENIFSNIYNYNSQDITYLGDVFNENINNLLNSTTNNFGYSTINFCNSYTGGSNIVKYENPIFNESNNYSIANISEEINPIRNYMSENVNNIYPQRTIWQPMENIGGGIGNGGKGERLGLNMRVTPRRSEASQRGMRDNGNYSRQARREQALFDIAQKHMITESGFQQPAGLTREDVRGIVMDTVIEAMR